MNEFEKASKKFTGIVRIEDVQNEFDRILQGINDAIDKINLVNNEALDSDEWLKQGSSKVPSRRYTLTLAALKSIIDAIPDDKFSNPVCVKDGDNNLVMFPTLVKDIDSKGLKQIPSQKLAKASTATSLYYDLDEEELGYSFPSATHLVFLGLLDWTRNIQRLNTTENNLYFNKDNSTVVKMQGNKFDVTRAMNRPSNRPFFYIPSIRYQDDNRNTTIRLANTVIFRRHTDAQTHRACCVFTYAPIFIPKGLQNKITIENDAGYHTGQILDFSLNDV